MRAQIEPRKLGCFSTPNRDLFSLWQYVEEIKAEVEEVERSPGDDENNADPNQEVVCLPPSLILLADSGDSVGKSRKLLYYNFKIL